VKGVMKFEIGERVKIRKTDVKGEIISYKYEKEYKQGCIQESRRYFTKTKNSVFLWYDESELARDEYTFDPIFERKLLDDLIDIHLKNKQFDVVKKLNEEKQRLRGIN
jgi:hypothetical protein